MKKLFRNLIVCFITVVMIFATSSFFANNADAAAKKGKGGLKKEQLETMHKDLNTLTRKIYANSLFSPKDNETMINIKLDLDEAMLTSPNPEYAPLYYMEANILRKRNYKNESIECYQTIIENFGDTAFAPKSRQELMKMGVKIETPTESSDSEE